MSIKLHRGFTLIEMLIVLAIIGLLLGVVLESTSVTRAKARDTRRLSDMKEIQLGLALYYDVNRKYPNTSDGTDLNTLVAQKYIPTLPTDPLNGAAYPYTGSAYSYCLAITLENTTPDEPSATCTLSPVPSGNYIAIPPQ